MHSTSIKGTDDPCRIVSTKGDYAVQTSHNSQAGLLRGAALELKALLRARSSTERSIPSA
jgi:hypothetical protein